MTKRPYTAVDRALFADDFDLAVSGGCFARGLEAGQMCVGCSSCNCDTHENCVRPTTEETPGMTDLPYTDADLRTEAARQHYTATADPDFMGIGEQMEDSTVASTEDGETGLTWRELLVPEGGGSYEAYGEAQRAIDGLLGKAADVSEWAVNLGADGLEPSDGHALTVDGDGKPLVRVHFAFEPDMPEEMRDSFVIGIGQAIDAQRPGGDQ